MKEKETLNYTYQKGSLDKETRKSTTSWQCRDKRKYADLYLTFLHNNKKSVENVIDGGNH